MQSKSIYRFLATSAAALLISTSAAAAVFTSNISSATKWDSVASNLATGVAEAFPEGTQKHTIYVAPGRSVFERAVMASLAGELVKRGFIVTDNVMADAYRLDAQAVIVPSVKTYQPGTATGAAIGVDLAHSMNHSSFPVQVLGLGAIIDVWKTLASNSPDDPVQVVVLMSLTDRDGVVKARSSSGFVIDRSMSSAFWPAAAVPVKKMEVR